jgi:hypothetical protein
MPPIGAAPDASASRRSIGKPFIQVATWRAREAGTEEDCDSPSTRPAKYVAFSEEDRFANSAIVKLGAFAISGSAANAAAVRTTVKAGMTMRIRVLPRHSTFKPNDGTFERTYYACVSSSRFFRS